MSAAPLRTTVSRKPSSSFKFRCPTLTDSASLLSLYYKAVGGLWIAVVSPTRIIFISIFLGNILINPNFSSFSSIYVKVDR